jgi:NAD(P)-dependent dehydrogenase (short-subunit alcohol dehydrogenase family)
LITGAGGGLGRATAVRLGVEGAKLALTDRDEQTLADTVALLHDDYGVDAVSVVGDIAIVTTSAQLVAAALAAYGRIDGICNIAGISPAIPLADTTGDDFDLIMGINCKAQLFLIQAALPALREAGAGSIVNVSSVGGRVALPNLTVYGASKSAILGLTRGVAYELAGDNIRCNAVCPGGIDSAMADAVVASFPDRDTAIANLTGRQLFKRFADAGEIATLIAYLVSDESSFVTGATFSADAGHTAI